MSTLTMPSKRWLLVVVLSALASVTPGRGDDTPQKSKTEGLPPPVSLTTQQDHKRMLELLHIKSLRLGANPRDPNASNAVNYDEAKATPYPDLPNPLVLKSGQRVTTAPVWWKQRRPEIVEDFDDLPVESHELVALCAQRPVFISVGSQQVEGGWVDAKGMFLAGVGAGPAYKLLGKKDLGTTEFPRQETALIDGEVAFRQHSGGHTTGPNWPTFLRFAERYLTVPGAKGPRAQ